MSDRLLHERLREWASAIPFSFNEAWRTFGVSGNDNMLAAFADEIERQYVPVPRFPDGEPVHEGSETCYGTVSFTNVEVSDRGRGNWVLRFDDGNCIEGTYSQRVERPAPDSLEKLRDDMKLIADHYPDSISTPGEWAKRLTALMERGA